MPTWVPVVAAAILDPQGRALMQQRPEGKHHAGLWEFPGGKVKPGEKPRSALIRELAEELGISADETELVPVGFADEGEDAQDRPLVILLYKLSEFSGQPRSTEGAQIGWHTSETLLPLPLAPLDRYLAARLF
nr:(deoxy)nucleoside triphosphate pyrophosphohydrolase [Alteripontixanthobacter muriae]